MKSKYLYNILLIALILLILWKIWNDNTFEMYGPKTQVFVPVGEDRYDLRGNKMNTRDIYYNYMKPQRHIILNESGGEMWKSDYAPIKEEIKNCKKIKCPENENDYDEMDTCHMCKLDKGYCDNTNFN